MGKFGGTHIKSIEMDAFLLSAEFHYNCYKTTGQKIEAIRHMRWRM